MVFLCDSASKESTKMRMAAADAEISINNKRLRGRFPGALIHIFLFFDEIAIQRHLSDRYINMFQYFCIKSIRMIYFKYNDYYWAVFKIRFAITLEMQNLFREMIESNFSSNGECFVFKSFGPFNNWILSTKSTTSIAIFFPRVLQLHCILRGLCAF